MKDRIFIGKVKPSLKHVGDKQLPTKRKDAFGEIPIGAVRVARVNTQYGTLNIPIKYLGKKIIITMEERK